MEILSTILSIIASLFTILIGILEIYDNQLSYIIKEVNFFNIKFNIKIAIIQYIILGVILILIIFLEIISNEKKKREKKFINFIKYLFSQKLDTLSKMCLELDSTKKYNNLKIDNLIIEYNYDINKSVLNKKSNLQINTPVNTTYKIKAKNFIIPNIVGFHIIDSNEDESKNIIVTQKYGTQSEEIEIKKFDISDIDSKIKYYSYEFDKKYKVKTEKDIIEYISNEMKGDFQYGQFKNIVSDYISISNTMKKMEEKQRSKER